MHSLLFANRGVAIWRAAGYVVLIAACDEEPAPWQRVFDGVACKHVRCVEEPEIGFGIGGVWHYGDDCRYILAGPEATSQLGLRCAGQLKLCPGSRFEEFNWFDRGPNGEGNGEGFTALGASIRFDDDGVGAAWTAFGDAIVESQGCTSRVRVVIGCENDDSNTLGDFHCRKFSGYLSGNCGFTRDYWVVSDFTFRRSTIACE